MITMQWWELILACLCWQVVWTFTSAVIGVVRDYRRTCPQQRTLPASQINVRCFKLLTNGECPDHGRVR